MKLRQLIKGCISCCSQPPAFNTIATQNNKFSALTVCRSTLPFLNIDQMIVAVKRKTSIPAEFNSSPNSYNPKQNCVQARSRSSLRVGVVEEETITTGDDFSDPTKHAWQSVLHVQHYTNYTPLITCPPPPISFCFIYFTEIQPSQFICAQEHPHSVVIKNTKHVINTSRGQTEAINCGCSIQQEHHTTEQQEQDFTYHVTRVIRDNRQVYCGGFGVKAKKTKHTTYYYYGNIFIILMRQSVNFV